MLAAELNESGAIGFALELGFDQRQFGGHGDAGHVVQLRRSQRSLQIVALNRADVFDFQFSEQAFPWLG
ncbi:MAG: hypothetical protein RL513_2139, partial [Pseudomonadota bacterium]